MDLISTETEVVSPNLMTMPHELRNMILANLLVSSAEIRPFDTDIWPLWPSVLQVCIQIYEEGRQILYKKNTILLDRPRHAEHFLERIRLNRRLLRSLEINLNLGTPASIGLPRMDRSDHPTQNHVTLGYQPSHNDLRKLAGHMLGWSRVLEKLPRTVKSIFIVPYDFRSRCNHLLLNWPASATWYCPGCRLQQFVNSNPIEDFIPKNLAAITKFAPKPQAVVSAEPSAKKNGSTWELWVLRHYLWEVDLSFVQQIDN